MLSKFISFLEKSPYAPYSAADIKDTNGESVLIRAKDDKGASKSLYYSYNEEDGRAWGHYHSCRSATGDTWFSKAEKSWTDEERAEWEAIRKSKQQEIERLRVEAQERVATECKKRYAGLVSATDNHPYLVKKGIKCPAKVKIDNDGNLIIPAIDINNNILTLQSISPDGEKRFTYQGRKDGTFFPINLTAKDTPTLIFVCEGMATGQSIFEATGGHVIVAWDAGNLIPVTRAIVGRYPDASVVIASDNDQWTFKNPRPKELADLSSSEIVGDDTRWTKWRDMGYLHNKGQEMAGKAALIAGGRVIHPDFNASHPDKPTDYNDLHRLSGLDAIKDRLLGTITPEVAPMVVEHDSPNQYAPAIGDEIDYGYHYEPQEGVYSVKKKEAAVKRADGNPIWFDDMIWDKEPSAGLPSIYAIKQLHDGKSMNNLITFIRGYFPKLFILNEFSDEITVRYRPPWLTDKEEFRVHRVNESDRINLSAFLEFFGFKVSDKTAEKAIISIAEKDKEHPVMEYFNELIWDGIPRLDTWLKDYTGSNQDIRYLSSIGSKWLMAGVARIFQAGCQFSHMLVLEGAQDIGKSALLRQLATFGDDIEESYFTDGISAKGCTDKFAAMMWQGKLIIEFGELGGMDKADIETVKAWISRREDEYQKKGSNDIMKRPRQFILSGTTNRRNWINDATGGKRFWPVSCSFADVDGLKKVKKQLWAEAVSRYKDGERYWLDDDDEAYTLAKVEQTVRLNTDEWQDILEMSVIGKSYVLPREVYELLHIDIGHLDNGKSARIRSAMQALGFEYKQCFRLTGNKNRVWVKE